MHDVRNRVWRRLSFFRYEAFIHAGVPRVSCPGHGVRAVPVPWARPGGGSTPLFEAMVVEPVKGVYHRFVLCVVITGIGQSDCLI